MNNKVFIASALLLVMVGAHAAERSLTCKNIITADNQIRPYHLKVTEHKDGSVEVNSPKTNILTNGWSDQNHSEWTSVGTLEDGKDYSVVVIKHDSGFDVHYLHDYTMTTAVDCKTHGNWN